jgi:hypothetical protein
MNVVNSDVPMAIMIPRGPAMAALRVSSDIYIRCEEIRLLVNMKTNMGAGIVTGEGILS